MLRSQSEREARERAMLERQKAPGQKPRKPKKRRQRKPTEAQRFRYRLDFRTSQVWLWNRPEYQGTDYFAQELQALQRAFRCAPRDACSASRYWLSPRWLSQVKLLP